MENFAVVFTMHNQKTAVVLCCYTSYASPKHFNNGRKLGKLIIFLVFFNYGRQHVFTGN